MKCIYTHSIKLACHEVKSAQGLQPGEPNKISNSKEEVKRQSGFFEMEITPCQDFNILWKFVLNKALIYCGFILLISSFGISM